MEIKNNVLTVIAHDKEVRIDLPEVAADSQVTAWEVPKSYQRDGVFVSVARSGQTAEAPACSQKHARLIGVATLQLSATAELAELKALKLAELCTACQKAAGELSTEYPEAEILSWPQQTAEAEALELNSSAETPLLNALSSARGVPVAELAQRVLQKKHAHAIASGEIIGRWQKAKDLVDEAQTKDEIIAVEFSLA